MRRSNDLMGMDTEELMAAYNRSLGDPTIPGWRILAMHHELQRRKRISPEAYEIYEQLLSPEDLTDPTGTKLTPSWHGQKCQGNGEHPGIECCCDECDFYLVCFPDWKEQF